MADSTPLGAFRFQVELAQRGPRGGAGRTFEVDVSEVLLPAFRREPDRTIKRPEVPPSPRPESADDLLVLRRGHTGSTEFYDWWEDERNPKRRIRRDVIVTLLNENGKPFTSWVFDECRLESFRYSPLDALESAVLIETAEISFQRAKQERRTSR